ncbi:MAG TPA: hydantoinase B/oxoprolinase family protein, partial [Oceanipulchritudo sp.]|nr:hydantoinase B/oxoprolinase family protein [Oceanipulchritudo sp.]
VIITNHPAVGGSHLPDVTLICGIFDEKGNRLGFLANRAHHAELGGRSPGSMPADAKCLIEEGVIIDPQWLVRNNQDHLEQIERLLRESPFPSRAVRENRIDLEAQLAALQRGRQIFDGLLGDYGPTTINRYFDEFYQAGAEALARTLSVSGKFEGSAREELDDGHAIVVGIKGESNRLSIDFTGTSPVHPGNLNATPAIVRSAVLYVLRLFVDTPMPLNEGLLDAVEITLPECFLNPAFSQDPANCPAVVGGNVETSQRVVDALIRALGLMAASQGTMNNLLFGNERFGYYETIGGGAGSGDGFPGASGVHVHMTNTAITDPEILEQRFPVTCREFSIRKNSGGAGHYRGGDGLVREVAFKEAVSLSLLSQNRKNGPKGMHGGGDGQPGRQWIVRTDGSWEPIPGVAQITLNPGEGIRIETPGGGGWGA